MTASALLADFRRRGLELTPAADGIRVRGPRAALTDVDRAELRALKDAVRALLVAESGGTAPEESCGLCHATAWRWEPAWHEGGRGAWLCNACVTHSAPTLPEVYDTLTPPERDRLAAENKTGDRLAQLVLDAVHCAPEPAAWRLHSRRLARELWVARDAEAVVDLERDGARDGLPVVLADDLGRLRDFDHQQLKELLDLLAILPGARLAQLEAEGSA